VKRGRGAHHSDAFTVVRIDAEETLVGELAVGRSEQLVVRGGTPRWPDAWGRVSGVDPSSGAASTGGVLGGGPIGWWWQWRVHGGQRLRSWRKIPIDGEAEALENDLVWPQAAVLDGSMALCIMGSRGGVWGEEQNSVGFMNKEWVLLTPSVVAVRG
jgi:hypothetical protein